MLVYSIRRINMKSEFYLFQSLTKIPGSKLSVLLPTEVQKKHRLVCYVIETCAVGMDSDQCFYVLLSILGEGISFL